MNKLTKVLYIKIGKVSTSTLENSKKKELTSGIKKYPVQKSFLTKIGFIDDEQADLKHHGGENKALFLFSEKTYKKINSECNTKFKIDEMAYFGENLVVSNVCEENIYIGDIYEIGEAIVQITQPREPCWKLSANTNIKDMTKFIFDRGYTGWYAKVLKEGLIAQNDEIKLIQKGENGLSIGMLNRLMVNPSLDKKLIKKAIISKVLGKPFQISLEKRFKTSL